MPRATASSKSRKVPGGKPPAEAVREEAPAKVAVPLRVERPPAEEPVWLVRIVLVLFFVGFAAFLAREVYGFVQSLP